MGLVRSIGTPDRRWSSPGVTKRRREVAELLQALLDRHPNERVYVAWDNASTIRMTSRSGAARCSRSPLSCCTCPPTAHGSIQLKCCGGTSGARSRTASCTTVSKRWWQPPASSSNATTRNPAARAPLSAPRTPPPPPLTSERVLSGVSQKFAHRILRPIRGFGRRSWSRQTASALRCWQQRSCEWSFQRRGWWESAARSRRAVSTENQHSTRLSQDPEVSVKCSCTLGCLSSQRWMRGVLCVLALSSTRCRSNSAGVARSTVCRK